MRLSGALGYWCEHAPGCTRPALSRNPKPPLYSWRCRFDAPSASRGSAPGSTQQSECQLFGRAAPYPPGARHLRWGAHQEALAAPVAGEGGREAGMWGGHAWMGSYSVAAG